MTDKDQPMPSDRDDIRPGTELFKVIRLDRVSDNEVFNAATNLSEKLLGHAVERPLVFDEDLLIEDNERATTLVLYSAASNTTIEVQLVVTCDSADDSVLERYTYGLGKLSWGEVLQQIKTGNATFTAKLSADFIDGEHGPGGDGYYGFASYWDDHELVHKGSFSATFTLGGADADKTDGPVFDASLGRFDSDDREQFNLGTINSMRKWVEGAVELKPHSADNARALGATAFEAGNPDD